MLFLLFSDRVWEAIQDASVISSHEEFEIKNEEYHNEEFGEQN